MSFTNSGMAACDLSSSRRTSTGIQTRLGKLQLLDVDDEITREKIHVVRQRDRHRGISMGGMMLWPSAVDEVQLELVRALVAGAERDAQRDGALRMHGGQLRCVNRVKRAEEIELAVILGRGVAQNQPLECSYRKIKPRIPRIGTNFFSIP